MLPGSVKLEVLGSPGLAKIHRRLRMKEKYISV
jgi:hypothetical protein